LAADDAPVMADDFAALFSAITAEPQLEKPRKTQQRDAVTVNVNGREFRVPRALSRLANQHGKWLQLGGVATAKLPAGDKMHVSLLYIDKGTEIPNHTHLGLEMTLVLSGTICDENGEYGAGDLLINTPADTHTPHTRADEDCLCLSVLSAPLKFNKGLTRLLNPLQQFFY
jgi:putative transcriptional regulator